MDPKFFDQIKLFLPSYLSPANKEQLFAELKSFPSNTNYYLKNSSEITDLFQGDGWQGLVVTNFHTREQKAVTGILISNTCDLDSANQRDLPVRILFAPIIGMDRMRAMYQAVGKSDAQIAQLLHSIRTQEVTNIFYLPTSPSGIGESIVLLDDIHQHPRDHFLASERRGVFRLSQFGFYIFLLKLSIHLTRFNEGVERVAA